MCSRGLDLLQQWLKHPSGSSARQATWADCTYNCQVQQPQDPKPLRTDRSALNLKICWEGSSQATCFNFTSWPIVDSNMPNNDIIYCLWKPVTKCYKYQRTWGSLSAIQKVKSTRSLPVDPWPTYLPEEKLVSVRDASGPSLRSSYFPFSACCNLLATAVIRAAPFPLPSSDSMNVTSHRGASSFTVSCNIQEKLWKRKKSIISTYTWNQHIHNWCQSSLFLAACFSKL